MGDPERDRVMSVAMDVGNSVDPRLAVEVLTDLVAIPSEDPPGLEHEAALHVAAVGRSVGLAVDVVEVSGGRPNVFLRTGSGPPRVLLNTHTDVVPAGEGWTREPYHPAVTEGRLYGRGAADAKGSLAAMVAAMAALARVSGSVKGEVFLAAVMGEEEGQLGTRALAASGLAAHWAVVGEPTDLRLVTAHKGTMVFSIETHGKASHGSVPHLGVNAIQLMSSFVNRLTSYQNDLAGRKAHPLLGMPTVNLGTVAGGRCSYMVPDRCVATVDRRILPGEDPHVVEEEFRQLVETCRRADSRFEGRVLVTELCPAMETSRSSDVVEALASACRLHQIDPVLVGWPATCDANILVNDLRIPTVVFGPGKLETAHQPDEHVRLDHVVQAARIYASLAVLLLSSDQGSGGGRRNAETTSG